MGCMTGVFESMKVLITGGAGFIGSALVRHLIAETQWQIVNVDSLTYAGNLESLSTVQYNPRYRFHQTDICDRAAMARILADEQPYAVMHLAAESHVDRSIDKPSAFVETNIVGTYILLEETARYHAGLSGAKAEGFRFHHISTDEVFGSLGPDGAFHENSPYRPNSPYSASKAASDHLARAWFHTYGLPVIITNCSNNYGPYQFPEKLIPLIISRAREGKNLPVYGTGENVRDWLHVEDHARALALVVQSGRPGEVYNIGGSAERRNIDVVRAICDLLDSLHPSGKPHADLITFVTDRPGHDQRYAMDCSKIQRELGWSPQETFESGLAATVEWYLDNAAWSSRILSGAYRTERLGLKEAP